MTFWGPYLLLQHSPDDGESGIVFRNARMGCVQHLSLIRTQGSEGEGDHAKRERADSRSLCCRRACGLGGSPHLIAVLGPHRDGDVDHPGLAAGLAIPLVSSAAVLASIGRRLSSRRPALLVLSISRFDGVALSRLSLLSDLGAWQAARVSICARKSCILLY